MMDTAGLLLRLGLSFLAVLALMWLAARLVRGSASRGLGVVELLARQQVGRGAAVAVLRVADRALVIGVTDSMVTLIGETDLEAVEASRVQPVRPDAGPSSGGAPDGPLAGSVLSPATWRRALEALRDRTARRG